MEYFGELGRLVPLRCASTERAQSAARYVPSVTVEGRRRVQAIPASPRTWDLSWGLADPSEMVALSGFVTGAWGAGPFHWVPVQAWKHNLLTPREAMLVDRQSNALWTEGGPVVGTDGSLAPRSMLSARDASWASLFVDIPCIPGRAITWAADVAGDGSAPPALASAFFDAAGGQIGSGVAEHGTEAEGMERVSQTRVPPEGAASFRAGIYHTTKRIARPQVTWTDGPVPYSAGHGCRAAVLDGMSEDLLTANSFGTWSSTSFTVMEVG